MRLRDIRLGQDTLSDILTAAIPLIGICVGTGVIAIILRFASGKW